MRLRRLWSQQWFRIQKVAPIVNMVLLMLTASLTLAERIEWRGWPVYVTVPALFLVIAALALAAANAWFRLQLHLTDRYAGAVHDPAQVYAFTPREASTWLMVTLPAMQAEINLWRSRGVDVSEWQAAHDKMRNWVTQGYIPRGEAPAHLRRHYVGTQGAAI